MLTEEGGERRKKRTRGPPCFSSLLALKEGVSPSGTSIMIAASGRRKEGTHLRVWGMRKGHLIQKNFSPRKNSGQAANQTAYLILMVDDADMREKGPWTTLDFSL